MPQIIAGFDVATRTGCAIDDGKAIRVVSFKARAKRPFGLKATEISHEHEAAIEEEFRDWVHALLIAEGIEHLAYEKPADRSFERTTTEVDTASEWAGQSFKKKVAASSSPLTLIRAHRLVGTVVGVAQRLNIPRTEVTMDDWRKSILGFSRAPKSEKDGRTYLKRAVAERCRLLGVQVKNDDEGDAVGVVFHLRGLLNPQRFAMGNDLFTLPPSGGVAPTAAL